LDHPSAPCQAHELPPLTHWLYFAPAERQSQLDRDGHPKRGGFLPPVALPRRMWVGSRIQFRCAIPVGASLVRRSTIANVSRKQGRSGELVFVTARHEILAGDAPSLIEEQDLVFRSAETAWGARARPSRRPMQVSEATRVHQPTPAELFRFSALTFNAHRIHYDRDYAREVEGYPALVVQGPWVALLLMDHYLRRCPDSRVRAFSFRAERPLFDTAPIELNFTHRASGVELWAVDGAGELAMSAAAELE
jgi:3-methylfumaryl-CoA hydratase